MARILQVCNSSFFLLKFLAPLVLELKGQGHEVVCLTDGKLPANSLLQGRVEVIDFEFPRSFNPFGFLNAIGQMKKIIEQGNFDLVNSHNRNSSFIARIACFLAIKRTKGQPARPINLYTARGFYFHDGQGVIKKALSLFIEAILAKMTHWTLSQSAEDVDLVTRLKIVGPEKITTIFNGIPTDVFLPREKAEKKRLEQKLQLPPAHFRICTTARFVPGKGLEDLIRAFARVSKSGDQLLLIGGNIPQDRGGLHNSLMKMIEELSLDNKILVTGMTDRVPEYLAVSDAFILPSYREGMPRSLIEALSCGLPSAASDIRGCREILQLCDPRPILFRPGNEEQIGRAIEQLKQRAQDNSPNPEFTERVKSLFDQQLYLNRQVLAIQQLTGQQ